MARGAMAGAWNRTEAGCEEEWGNKSGLMPCAEGPTATTLTNSELNFKHIIKATRNVYAYMYKSCGKTATHDYV